MISTTNFVMKPLGQKKKKQGKPSTKKLRVDSMLDEPFFTNFGDEFLECFFNGLIMTV